MFPGFRKNKRETNGKQQLPVVCFKQKTANFCLFPANGNGKQKTKVSFPWSAKNKR
jgi:hypothetical protein